MLQLSDIIVPEGRQRKNFDEKRLNALADSIYQYGLIHCPVLDETNKLIVGERRLRAVKLLAAKGLAFRYQDITYKPGTIPISRISELSAADRYAVELEENLNRENLTWQEKAEALVKLHNFRSEQSGGIQSLVSTAAEAGASPETVKTALIVTAHLSDPEVAGAKDQKEALKVIKRKADVVQRAELSKKFDMKATPHTLIHGDCYQYLAGIEERFDCIICDPPYGVSANKFGEQAGTAHDYEDNDREFNKVKDLFGHVAYKVAKPGAFLYLFCDISKFFELNLTYTLDGWNVWSRPLIWNKMGGGMLPAPEYGPRNSYECILFALKGDRKLVKQAMPDVISVRPIKRLLHGAQKPAMLYADLLSRVCLPGDRILDAFGGSGTAFVAANTMKLTATVIERVRESHDIALSRINSTEIFEDAEDFQI